MTSISTSASVVIPRPREQVFAFATDSTNASSTIRPRGPFAGISKIEMHEGQSLAKGSKRRIFMTYTFGLTSLLAYPLAIPIAWLFKGWMQQGLDAIRAELLSLPSRQAVKLNESRLVGVDPVGTSRRR